MTRKVGTTTIRHLLEDERVRKAELDGQTHYSAADVITVLSESPDSKQEWEEFKHFNRSLRTQSVRIELPGDEEPQDVLTLAGVLRLIQMIDAPKAIRLSNWLAEVAAQHVEEEADPELAVHRVRQGYRAKGHSRQWIDQRLRCISARNELIGEWYKRGVKEADQFSALTNRLMEATFGMDVNAYRRHKGIEQNLRDHLSDLELALISLAETTAAALHRQRVSHGFEELLRDVRDAGLMIRRTRKQIMQATAEASPLSPVAA